MQNSTDKFNAWWKAAKLDSPLRKKSAVCVSTITKDGFPNGRFVDLKAADEKGFTFCTFLDSTKGREIEENPKVAITIWWDHVGFQVRICGIAKRISNDEAIKHWKKRSREAQISTISCIQSQILDSETNLLKQWDVTKEKLGENEIPKPSQWGGIHRKAPQH